MTPTMMPIPTALLQGDGATATAKDRARNFLFPTKGPRFTLPLPHKQIDSGKAHIVSDFDYAPTDLIIVLKRREYPKQGVRYYYNVTYITHFSSCTKQYILSRTRGLAEQHRWKGHPPWYIGPAPAEDCSSASLHQQLPDSLLSLLARHLALSVRSAAGLSGGSYFI